MRKNIGISSPDRINPALPPLLYPIMAWSVALGEMVRLRSARACHPQHSPVSAAINISFFI